MGQPFPKMEGSQGLLMFKDALASAERSRQLMNKRQKLQLAATRQAGDRHDLLSDWSPLIERVFSIVQ